ncbi:MAG: hypothetical protein ABIU97_00430, partial [Dehalococcoidia bacterium]
RQSIAAEYADQLERLRAALRLEAHTAEQGWLIKRDACLKALTVANAVLSNQSYSNIPQEHIVPQTETVANARACLDALACSCEGPEVIDELKKIMFGQVGPDAIVDLRAAVRRELGFASHTVDTDREKAFIGRLNCDPATTDSLPSSRELPADIAHSRSAV